MPEQKSPRVYLYDDFLGRTSLTEKLRKNEDHRLVNFILAVRNSKLSKLILTTREYILHQAQKTYEMLNGPIFERPQCIIDLSQYTRPIRAQILYNHLYFSNLASDYIEAIIKQEAYLKVIDHKNFNPRIIEYMTDPMWIGCEDPNQYPALFLKNLQEPFLIWEQAFNNQISDLARDMLVVLGTLPNEVFVEDFLLAVKQFVSYDNLTITQKEFRQSLSELHGNFIILEQDHGNDIIAFHNPSFQDFINNYMEKNPTIYKAIGKTICFFEQLQWLCERKLTKEFTYQMKETILTCIQKVLHTIPCTLLNYKYGNETSTRKGRASLSYVRRLAYIASLLKKGKFGFLSDFLKENLINVTSQISSNNHSNADLLYLVEEIKSLNFPQDIKDNLLSAIKESFYKNLYWILDVSYLTDFLDILPELRTSEDNNLIIKSLNYIVDNNLDVDDPQWLRSELNYLERINEEKNFKLDKQINKVRKLLSEAEENCSSEEDFDNERYRELSYDEHSIGDKSLVDMFSTLLQK